MPGLAQERHTHEMGELALAHDSHLASTRMFSSTVDSRQRDNKQREQQQQQQLAPRGFNHSSHLYQEDVRLCSVIPGPRGAVLGARRGRPDRTLDQHSINPILSATAPPYYPAQAAPLGREGRNYLMTFQSSCLLPHLPTLRRCYTL